MFVFMTCTNGDTNRKLDAWVWRLIRDPIGELDLGITCIKKYSGRHRGGESSSLEACNKK